MSPTTFAHLLGALLTTGGLYARLTERFLWWRPLMFVGFLVAHIPDLLIQRGS